jgi:hypothetical protein
MTTFSKPKAASETGRDGFETALAPLGLCFIGIGVA